MKSVVCLKTNLGLDRLRVGWGTVLCYLGGGHTRQDHVEMSPTQSRISPSMLVYEDERQRLRKFYMETLAIHKRGFNQNYNTFTLVLLIKIICAVNFLELSLQIRSI